MLLGVKENILRDTERMEHIISPELVEIIRLFVLYASGTLTGYPSSVIGPDSNSAKLISVYPFRQSMFFAPGSGPPALPKPHLILGRRIQPLKQVMNCIAASAQYKSRQHYSQGLRKIEIYRDNLIYDGKESTRPATAITVEKAKLIAWSTNRKVLG